VASVISAAVSAGAWLAFILATSAGDRVVTLLVALIGAVASVAAAKFSHAAHKESRRRRLVITKTDTGVTITDDEIGELEVDDAGPE
jgi:hypothetical protein